MYILSNSNEKIDQEDEIEFDSGIFKGPQEDDDFE